MPTSDMLAILIPVMMGVTSFLYKYSNTHKKYKGLFKGVLGLTVFLVIVTIVTWSCTVSHKETSYEKSDKTMGGGESENTEGYNEAKQGQSASDTIIKDNWISEPNLDLGGWVPLEKTNTLFDGSYYYYYTSSDEDTFSVGSGTYTSGFILYQNFSTENAFVLFDLKGRYAEVQFDVGRVRNSMYNDAVMRIYIDNQEPEEFNLSASEASKSFNVDLRYASDLKIEIITDPKSLEVKYGFYNMFFLDRAYN